MMRLTVSSILLGVGVAVVIPVDPTTSHDDPKVIVAPIEPAYYPPGQRTTHAYHQATVPTSTPVASDVVPEAKALEARRDIIGAQKFRCVAECLQIHPPYLLPIEPRFANCQRHCNQVVGEEIAGDDDDDSLTSLIQALEASPEAIGDQLRCIHLCRETPRDSAPASDHRENPTIAACRRWCSSNSRPEATGGDDGQDLTSPIEARDAIPPPSNFSCVLECYRKDKAERAECYRKCYEEMRPKIDLQPAKFPFNSSIEVRHVADPDDIAPPGSIECLADCLRGPARTQEDVDAMAKCIRRCNDALESPGNNTTTNDTPASSSTIEVRYAAAGHPDVIPPPPSIECLLQCIFSPDVNGNDEVESCERRCNDALKSPGNNNTTTTNGTLATAPSIQARDATPEVLGEGDCSSGCSAGKHSTLNWLKECLERCRPAPAEDSSERALPAPTGPTDAEGPCVNLCVDGLPSKSKASVEACRRWCAKSQDPEANEIHTAASVAGKDEQSHLEDAPPEKDFKPLLCIMDCMKSLPDGDEEGRRKECRRRCTISRHPKNNGTITAAVAGQDEEAQDAPTPETDLKPLLCLMNCMESLPDGEDKREKKCRRHCNISQYPKANETLITAAAIPDNNKAAQDEENPYSALPTIVCLIRCMQSLPGGGDDKGRDECARRCIPGRNNTTTATASTLDNGPIGSSTTEAREVHPEGLFRSSCGDPECEPNCLNFIPPESIEARRRCLRRCCPTRGREGKKAHEDAQLEEDGKVHPEGGLFRSSSCGDPECEPNCLKAIPPESTEERRRCLRRCCPTRGREGKKAHEDAAHPEEEGVVVVVEKRDCGSDCIANSHSKPEETACFQKCQDKGELNFTDPTGQQPPSPHI